MNKEQAKEEGKWRAGLDSNKSLFKEVDDEAIKKIELLLSMIDE